MGVVVCGATAGWALRDRRPPAEVDAALKAVAKPTPPPPLDPAVLGPLKARVRAVHGAAAMLTEAEARRRSGEQDLAIAATERAVVGDPENVEALALLATLYAETSRFPEAWQPLLDAARARSPASPSTRRAESAVALARGDLPGAEAAAATCLREVPDSLICRESLADAHVAIAAEPAARAAAVAELDALLAEWPDNTHLRRVAALLAARAEAPGAEARLDALLREAPDDRELLEARALLAAQVGDLPAARALAKTLDPPSDRLLYELAAVAWAKGDPTAAARDLARRVGAPDAATLLLQAELALARGKLPDARAAVGKLTELAPGSPSTVQVRIALALRTNGAEDAAKAAAALDADHAPPLDAARAWVAVGAADLARDRPADARIALDRAVALDGSDPETHLWRMSAALAAADPTGVTAAAQDAIVQVDGRHLHRPLHRGAQVLAARAAPLRAGLGALYGDDPARADDRALAEAVAAWLSGNTAGALADLAPLAERGEPFALALRGRLSEPALAAESYEAALVRRPKEMAWQLARADALITLRQLDAATAAFTAAKSGAVPEVTLRRVAARLADARGDSASASAERREILALEPGDVETRRVLRSAAPPNPQARPPG